MKGVQLMLPLEFPPTDLQTWKLDNGYTVDQVAELIQVSRSHTWRALKGLNPLPEKGEKRFKYIKRQQEIIAGNPMDKILLEYELEQYIEEGGMV